MICGSRPRTFLRRVGVMLWAALLACVTGCVTHVPMADRYEGPEALPQDLAEPFEYESASLEFEADELRERRKFVVREVVLPAIEEPVGERVADEVVFEYYDVDGDEVTPVVVVLPIVNGNMLVSRYFARYFASRGWASVVVDRAGDPLGNALDEPESVIRRNIRDYRRVLDWAERNDAFDTVGIFGISFGGMAAVMLAALDDRVDAVVAAMAGGDLPYLMMNTSYRSVARKVHKRLRETGLSREHLEARLDEMVQSDPLAFAPYVDAEEIMLVMTRTDMIVPFEAQQWLRESLGEPETLFLPTGHRTSVFYFPLLRSSAYDFFERQFAAAAGS